MGLIGAKRTGGDAAVGDVIVFFDCHVKPDPNYWKPFVTHLAANPKRVVVPVITELDVDTWEELGVRSAGHGMSKCYLTRGRCAGASTPRGGRVDAAGPTRRRRGIDRSPTVLFQCLSQPKLIN